MSKTVFRPRARLLLQLGDQLIKNESIALLELVKNSYDADASKVVIEMERLNDPDKGVICVSDDGHGMDKKIVTDVWLDPGSNHKAQQLELLIGTERKSKRRPLGEKGIGRFSAHKLGNSVELITRMEGKKEVYVKIDWTEFEKAKYIDEVPIKVIERDPKVFTGKKTGTVLKIQNLRPAQWSEKILREVNRSINAISSPFETPDAFRVVFETDTPDVFEGIPTIEEIRKSALYRFRCEMESDEIKSFLYEFQPYQSMDKLHKRYLSYNIPTLKNNFPRFDEIRKMVEKQTQNSKTGGKETPSINLAANRKKIGRIIFEGLIFDRQSKVLRYAHTDSKALRTYLDLNGGIRVYRDGVRVYDYGEPENDWLGLEKSRLYDPGVKINKGLILAAVHLDRESSTDLIEKTNREGFVDNEAYKTFREAVTYAVKLVETCRNEDKDLVRMYYGLSPKSEPVLASLADLKDLVESKVQDEKLQAECVRYIDKIEKDYQEINEISLLSGLETQ